MRKTTLGVFAGNRGFFPGHLCETGRLEVLRVLEEEGLEVAAVDPGDTPFGSVETPEDAKKCAALFEEHVAVKHSKVAAAVSEALGKYMGWSVYHHRG